MTSPLRSQGIGRRIVQASILTSSVALLLACIAFVAYERVTFFDTLGRELEVAADIVGRNSAAALTFNDVGSASATLEALRARENVLAAAIYTISGARFAGYPGTASGLPATLPVDYPAFQRGISSVIVRMPIAWKGEALGSVVVEGDLRELDERVFKYTTIAILVWLASLGVAFAIAVPMHRTISAPIVNLADKARQVSERQDFTVRAAEEGEHEVGILVRTFNQMLGHIQNRERELEAARDAALESSRLKTAFLANMSHEIRTPLNVILGYSEFMRDRLQDSEEPEDHVMLDAIRRAGARLMRTIEEILDISRIETGAFEPRRVVVPLAELIGRTVDELRILAEQKGLRIDCRVDTPGAAVLFDHYCLSHALMNLVSNAIKFTDRGGVTVRLFRSAEGALSIAVSDTGIGIAPEYLPHLFEAFSQEDPGMTRRFEGSGLGLALVRRYVELNGATVAVSSKKGHGSTFTIQFPPQSEVAIAPTTQAAVEPAAAPARAPAPDEDAAHAAVLVVEDDPDNQAYMRSILKSHYEVLTAATPPEAERLLALRGTEIAVICMDVALRDGAEDGLALTRSLRRNPEWKDIPIIVTTALAQPEDRAKAEAAGCTAYLPKPVTRNGLLRRARAPRGAHRQPRLTAARRPQRAMPSRSICCASGGSCR